ncbi:MAG: hypothetical protein BMS9Abin36_1084 [Gammaproteobacteria bacterium]|nr:MAG: hypothetical protein BMS9Abin36_1084 [Gammaproteobacteria bacterium]
MGTGPGLGGLVESSQHQLAPITETERAGLTQCQAMALMLEQPPLIKRPQVGFSETSYRKSLKTG